MVDNANEATTPAELVQGSTFKLANERTEAMLRLQKELLDVYDQASRDWLARLKSEVELWSGLATKLAGTRSVPDAMQSYQEYMSQRVKMAAADAQRMSEDCGSILQKINRSLTNGWSAGST
jgi:hypothetical protein